MSILIIGDRSFIGSSLKIRPETADWTFISHNQALDNEIWACKPQCVLNLAMDPVVKEGRFSDFDRILAQKTQEGGGHYIMMSSRTAYGVAPEEQYVTLQEETPSFNTMTPYGQAKLEIEQDLLQTIEPDLCTILRASNVFGMEYTMQKPRASFLGQMLYSLKKDNIINFDMAAETKRDFIPIGTFLSALISIVTQPKPGLLNIGSGVGTRCGDLAQWVIQGYGSGTLEVKSNATIKDSFVLSVEKLICDYNNLHSNFNFISKEIRSHCIAIGRKLKDS